jgi:molybdopterin-synthase adenylyltransferase
LNRRYVVLQVRWSLRGGDSSFVIPPCAVRQSPANQPAIGNPTRNSQIRHANPGNPDRDVIFLCDDHWGRAVVNEIAHQYLIPTINMGMRITSTDSRITHAIGVIDVLRPDNPCLWCTNALDAHRIAAESMPPAYRAALAAEAYVEGIDTKAPSVITINTTISGQGTTLFLQMLTDFMGEAGNVARINYDALTGTMRRGRATVANPCVCRKVKGFGDLRPLSVVDELPR